MTVTPFPRSGVPVSLEAVPTDDGYLDDELTEEDLDVPEVVPLPTLNSGFDIEEILASIDTMAAQKPVAAQIVSVANAEDTSAKALSKILATDVALASRVMKLANSAYFGMRGRVTSLQFAVTVVGFTTVRTMATVALTDLDDQSRLPEDFWQFSSALALSASVLAPRFGQRPQDALCLGLLAQMGAALLYHNDAEGYAELVAAEPGFMGRRAAESARYGVHSLRLTSIALEQWGFPASMTMQLNRVEDIHAFEGALLRSAFEVAARLTVEDYDQKLIGPLSDGRLREDDVAAVLDQVRIDADELRRAMLGE